MGAKVGQHIGVRANLEAVNRRVARNAPRAFVVVDDEKLAWLGEEIIQRASDDHVHIQKQGSALQAVQIGAEGGELIPAALGYARGQVQRWNGKALYFAAYARAVISQADEAKIALQVAPHHGVEAVDVVRPVLFAPFHAQDNALRAVVGLGLDGFRHGLQGVLGKGHQESWRQGWVRQGGYQSDWRFFRETGFFALARLILPPEVRRSLPKTRKVSTSGRWPPRLLYLSTLTWRGPGMRVSSWSWSFSGCGRHNTSNLPICWMGAALSWSARLW